jgi:hypothetical protein
MDNYFSLINLIKVLVLCLSTFIKKNPTSQVYIWNQLLIKGYFKIIYDSFKSFCKFFKSTVESF